MSDEILTRLATREPVPLRWRWLFLLLVGLVPTCFVLRQYSPTAGFTPLLICGSDFLARAVPELKALNPPCPNPSGYDGQLYAQLATDPFLRNPVVIDALDSPAYRSRRIFVPFLAWVSSLGNPSLALQIYSIANLAAFWILMLGMLRFLRPASGFEFSCLAAALLGTGSLMSVERALTDLPAATFGFFALMLGGFAGSGFLALACLSRETAILGLPAWTAPREILERRNLGRICLQLAVAVLPLLLWMFFLSLRFPLGSGVGVGNFSLPFLELFYTASRNLSKFLSVPLNFKFSAVTISEFFLTEITALLCLVIQSAHFAIYRNYNCRIWRSGVCFVALFVCLGPAVMAEQINYLRALLPLTLAFNLQLFVATHRFRWGWLILGNFGLWWGFHEMISKILRP